MKRMNALLALAIVIPALLVGARPTEAMFDNPPHTPGMVDTSTGIWQLWDPLLGKVSFYYGNPGDLPFVGDWDCDGVETPGLYRQSDGYVYVRNTNSQGVADIAFFFGNPGDVPLAGDFNGNGCDTVSLYRPSESRVFVINKLGSGDTGLGTSEFSYVFGDPGDVPFVGDFNGDAVDTIGLHRSTTGKVYFRNSHTTGVADADFVYGDPGDTIIAGDWTGSGTETVGIFRSGSGEFHLRHSNTAGIADETVLMDTSATTPMPVAGAIGRTGTVSVATYGCGPAADYTTSAFATLPPSPAPTTPSDAVGVLGMSFTRNPHCDRAVIALGASPTTFGFFEDAIPASSVPAGVEVAVIGNRVHVEMPGIERGAISRMEFLGDPLAFVVRQRGGGDLYVDILHTDHRRVRSFFLSNPARIVIDSISTATPTGVRLGPVVGEGVYLRDPLDPTGLGVTTPVRVVGYARPFEASDGVSLTDATTGKPAAATWWGCSVPPESDGSTCIYGTSDYIEAWGEFRFEIADLATGKYELEVFLTSPLETAPTFSVTDAFTVTGVGPDACPTDGMLVAVKAVLDSPPAVIETLSLSECNHPYARVFASTAPGQSFETEQVFLKDAIGTWTVLAFGTGIDCARDNVFAPPELEDACEALGLR